MHARIRWVALDPQRIIPTPRPQLPVKHHRHRIQGPTPPKPGPHAPPIHGSNRTEYGGHELRMHPMHPLRHVSQHHTGGHLPRQLIYHHMPLRPPHQETHLLRESKAIAPPQIIHMPPRHTPQPIRQDKGFPLEHTEHLLTPIPHGWEKRPRTGDIGRGTHGRPRTPAAQPAHPRKKGI